ncbi:MAG: gliding motility lipoprotein GldD [Bacteroidales bacterium]|nr:gliding motility lipoprotein GldD [Bacteroidales bacterium]
MNKIIASVLFVLLISCRHTEVPRPVGYFRIDFPEKKYKLCDSSMPYRFEYPVYGVIRPDTSKGAEPYWINIEFPAYKGKLHLSYKKVNGNLAQYIEDARKLAYKHTIKADAIDEILIKNDTTGVYGLLYDIKGNAASSVQFFLTDSTHHFLRGALYFSSQPNKDSLMPVIEFFKADVKHFIHSFRWKK